MKISGASSQLWTTDLAQSIEFYTNKIGLTLEFRYEDFYAGIRAGEQVFHLKYVCEKDPTIQFVDENEHFHLYFNTDNADELAETLKNNCVEFVRDVYTADWNAKEFIIKDDQGHTIYFGQSL